MVDGFHWTRVTSKQLRFLYEAVTLAPVPAAMYELAAKIDRIHAENADAPSTPEAGGADGTSPEGDKS